MSEPTFDNAGNLNLGPVTRNSDGRIAIDFERGDTAGLAMDVEANKLGLARIRLGDWYVEQSAAGAVQIRRVDNGLVTSILGESDSAEYVAPATPPLFSAIQINIPLVLAPTGSMGDNGALTSGTANPQTYTHSYVYFPDEALYAGSTLGWYYTEWSTTTAGTVYADQWDGLTVPTVPASPTAIAATGPGAFTGATTEALYAAFTVEAGDAEAGSRFEFDGQWAGTNGADDKIIRVRHDLIGGDVMWTSLLTGFAAREMHRSINVISPANEQSVHGVDISAAALVKATTLYTDQDYTVAFQFVLTIERETATDVIVIESFRITQVRA